MTKRFFSNLLDTPRAYIQRFFDDSKSLNAEERIKQNIMRSCTGIFILGPLIGEMINHFFSDLPAKTLFLSCGLLGFSILNFFLYMRGQRLENSLRAISIIPSLIYCWAILISGGLQSQYLIYLPLFIVINGLSFGRRGALYSSVLAVLFCATLLLLENLHLFSEAPKPQSNFLFGCHLVCATGLLGFFMHLFTTLRKDFELSSLSTSQILSQKENETRAEQSRLIEQDEHLRTIIDSMSEGLVVHNSKGQVIKFNAPALEILGLSEDQLLGRSSKELGWRSVRADGSDFPANEHPSAIAMRENRKVLGTKIGTHLPNGEIRWMRVNAVPFYNKVFSGELLTEADRSVLITFVDITELVKNKKHLESTLVQLNHRARVNQLLHFVDQAIAETLSSNALIPNILQSALKSETWIVVNFWQPKENRLILTETRSAKPEKHSTLLAQANRTLRPSQCLPGMARLAKAPYWISDFTSELGFTRKALVNSCGLKSGFAIPIFSESGLFGILEFLSEESFTIDFTLHQKLEAIAQSIGQARLRLTAQFKNSQLQNEIDLSTKRELAIEKSYHEMIEYAPVGIVKLSLKFDFLNTNPAFQKMLGYSNDELIKLSTEQLTHPEDRESSLHQRQLVGALGSEFRGFEKRWIHKDGRVIWTKTSARAVEEAQSGEKFILGIVEDISVLRTNENHAKQLWGALNGSALVAVTDAKGNITEVNDNFCQLSGYTRDELLGSNHRIVNSGTHPKEFFVELWRSISSGETWTGEIQNRNKHGEPYWVSTVISPMFDPSKNITGYLSIRFDITGQKRAEFSLNLEKVKTLQSSKLAALGEMSAGIAHEINNPLAIIDGAIGLLPKLALDPEKFRSKLEAISKASGRINKIVGGLKKFSRTGADFTFDYHFLNELIQESIVLTETKAKRDGVSLRFETNVNPIILCNEVEIEQVLINLINNGIDAARVFSEKWVKILVLEEANAIILRISDSGSGISSASKSRLFEPFFTTKKIGEGTGLGLSISKGILDQHHAKISLLEDLPNTCFEISFQKSMRHQLASPA